tara:strand:+ start:438 stop:1157 length:720 start_codon:yes stop_codon:yes gene_type:complete
MLGLGNSLTLSSVLPATPVVGEIAPSNLKVWLKRGTGQTSAGGKLSNWADSSSNSNSFAQSSGSLQPAISGDEVTFATNALLLISSFPSALSFGAFTFMHILNPNESVTLDDEFIFGAAADDGLKIYKDENNSRIEIEKNGSSTVINLSSSFPVGDNDFLLTITRDSSGNIAVRINGTQLGTATSDVNDLFDLIFLGVSSANGTQFDGQINEVVTYNTNLTGSDLTNAENDIMNRSGIL